MSTYIRMKDGSKHYFMEEFKPDIDLIANHIAYINRYNGGAGNWSVLKHSLLCYHIAYMNDEPDDVLLSVLLHDAPEAYIGDVCAPLKSLLPDYQKIEQHHHDVIDKFFNIDTRSDKVKLYDLCALKVENNKFDIIGRDDIKYPKEVDELLNVTFKFADEFDRHEELSEDFLILLFKEIFNRLS